eukprot:CAMPEP_0180140886 /NCGR_PEP_ID=MMETSP0986-20121125/14526_1 /TAXON_ID=697907 /ORGANISM="non described non described, Strain CCMP2293" /LENGTH=35 /DNA_ID= /DNA_START= /DNA_END= /DNA_ORIENTATION=
MAVHARASRARRDGNEGPRRPRDHALCNMISSLEL